MSWWSREWCCSLFRWAFESRRGRGQFIFASPPVPDAWPAHSFWLAFRSEAREHLSRMSREPLAPPDVKVYLSSIQAIFYCPWCGRRLARYYGKATAQLLDPELCRELQVPGWEQVDASN